MTARADLTLHAAQEGLRSGTIDPQALLEAFLERIAAHNQALNVYLDIDAEALRQQAREQWQRCPQGKLRGIPLAIKDNICMQGAEVTCSSKILGGFYAPYDATVIERLKAEGAVLIPRVNMDEFAFGSSTENSAFGPTRNPWNLDCVPGGSSGGSAAAVAASLAMAALGSDTGGSIRQPAAFCGVVGLKPTYGRVSRYGLIAFASSLDQIGPLAKDVRDAAILLSVIAGHDPRDSTAAPKAVPDYVAGLERPVKGLRMGVPQEYLGEGLQPAVRAAIEQALQVFEKAGMTVEPVNLPHTPYAVATYYIVATAEASSNLSRYDGVKYGYRDPSAGDLREMYSRTREQGFGNEVKRRVLLGTYVLSHGYYDAYYLKGLKVRTLIKRDFDRAFERCDVLLTPTAPTTAFRIGAKADDPLQMYLSDICTISANLAGVPAVSIPGGFSEDGLPIGLQLLAAPFQEEVLLRAAYAFEQATPWHTRRPTLAATRVAR
jgi:aspartyl-tRNA(Asn)/glutamyl-tRNA(Gln) amidotransferase subunit A